ncbi:DNA translocase FtsK [Paraliobacillus quinghaiensis]|uniref:DNA translocase FtsK n=1 Tax=Paraliobacillus quinghaiensis TaxID=470815 RepID=A0A917WRX9_9BACI|nr:DNA translocase FtsK [Paraliobacillus quinghaiensis]GGM26353.1 DNA translocase FtsK [Paraliobacillus quinghaiensis]
MWETIKNKMKQWLDPDENMELPESKINNNVDKHVETRVSYQYPSKKKFDFPVIPDKIENHPKIVTRQLDNTVDIDKHYRKREQQSPVKNDQNKRPFVATEVPSPVYGFKKRPSQENEIDTPAFMRKDSIHNQAKLTFEKFEVDPVDEDHSIDHWEEASDNEVSLINQPELVNDQIDSIESEEYSDNNVPIQSDSNIEVSNEEILHIDDSHSAEEKTSFIQQPSKKTEEKEGRAVPFNVLMRPRDKKHYHERNKQNKSKVTNLPPFYLLDDPIKHSDGNQLWIEEQAQLLETTLHQFHVNAKVINTMQGPSVTRFEIQPEAGVKVSKIKNLSDDIKLNMAAKDIRMEAPIPGKNAIGIEIPNIAAQPVGLQEIFKGKAFQSSNSNLSVGLGLDIAGSSVVTDIKKMPHGLIAGATGSGKSVCINSILISLLYKASHKDVRFLLIDPKMVELAPYNDIPHLVSPVITDVKAATHALKWAVMEMEERYEKFVQEGTRDIDRYNQKMIKQNRIEEKMPYMVIVIDELADLMMVSPQDVEDAICRIAQKARACGIHLLLATQRPSVDVITGLIKANIPTRIAFSVSSQVDSRTIIDTSGAERLLGKGDMLFVENGARNPVRIQGAFVSDDEIERITSYAKKMAPTNYLFEQEQLLKQVDTEETEDDLYSDVLSFVLEHNGASASLLQRRFKIGYNRAARLIDALEHNGIISTQKGSKPRDILVSASDLEQELNRTNN